MKNILIITIIAIAALVINIPTSSYALSDLASKLVKECYRLDAPFPPENWDKVDIRTAASEMLSEIEAGRLNPELTNFAIIALGRAGFQADIPVILGYYDDLPETVLSAVSGSSHPDAINFLIGKLKSDQIPTRELAALGISKINFNKTDNPRKWYDLVKGKLVDARDNEKENWLKDDLTKIIDNLVPPSVETNS